MRGGVAMALVAGIAAGVTIGACVKGASPRAGWESAQQQKNEITALSTQIRDWRREAGMDVEPDSRAISQFRSWSIRKVRKSAMCPQHRVPAACNDVCDLGDAICDNAERICTISAELPGDTWAEDKCDSAKASCREAKERCCSCDDLE